MACLVVHGGSGPVVAVLNGAFNITRGAGHCLITSGAVHWWSVWPSPPQHSRPTARNPGSTPACLVVHGGSGAGWVHHTKVLSGVKKARNQWGFFVVKGIIGQRYYESDFWPDLAR